MAKKSALIAGVLNKLGKRHEAIGYVRLVGEIMVGSLECGVGSCLMKNLKTRTTNH